MNISKIFLNLLKNKYSQIYTGLFFVSLLFIGLSIFKDYGLSTDEPFHRTIGYYWYISLLEIFLYHLVKLLNFFKPMSCHSCLAIQGKVAISAIE